MDIKNVEIHARVFSQTLAHANSKNEKKTKKQMKNAKIETYGKKKNWPKKIIFDGLTVGRAYRPPWELQPEAVDELPN